MASGLVVPVASSCTWLLLFLNSPRRRNVALNSFSLRRGGVVRCVVFMDPHLTLWCTPCVTLVMEHPAYSVAAAMNLNNLKAVRLS